MDAEQTLRAAELSLLDPSVRSDSDEVAALLHPDFVEIGRSGRRWTRDEIITELRAEAPRPTPATDEWEFVALGPGLTLVTYRLSAAGRTSRHASVWDTTGERPVLRFHQGTFVAEG